MTENNSSRLQIKFTPINFNRHHTVRMAYVFYLISCGWQERKISCHCRSLLSYHRKCDYINNFKAEEN